MKYQILFSWKNKKSRRYFEILFLIFPSKTGYDISGKLSPWKNKICRMHFVNVFIIFQGTGFTFHANCLQSMHEMSNLVFLGKIRKKYFRFVKCNLLKTLPRVISSIHAQAQEN